MAFEVLTKNRAQNYSYCEASQLSTNTVTVLSGSELDCRGCRNVSYTFSAATNGVTAVVYVANKSDFSDEVAFTTTVPGSISVGTNKWFAGSPTTGVPANCVFAYSRVKFDSTVDDSHGTLTVVGYAQ